MRMELLFLFTVIQLISLAQSVSCCKAVCSHRNWGRCLICRPRTILQQVIILRLNLDSADKFVTFIDLRMEEYGGVAQLVRAAES